MWSHHLSKALRWQPCTPLLPPSVLPPLWAPQSGQGWCSAMPPSSWCCCMRWFWPQSHLVRKFSAAVLVCVYVAQSSGMWSRPPFNAPYMQAIWPQYGVTSTLTAPCALGPALLVSADTPRHSLPHATVWAGSSLLRVCCRSRCLGMPAAHADPHLAPPSYHAIGCRRAGLNICFPNANGDCLGPPPYAGLLPSQVCKGQRRHLVTGDLLVVFAHRCYCHSNACAGLLQGADTVAW